MAVRSLDAGAAPLFRSLLLQFTLRTLLILPSLRLSRKLVQVYTHFAPPLYMCTTLQPPHSILSRLQPLHRMQRCAFVRFSSVRPRRPFTPLPIPRERSQLARRRSLTRLMILLVDPALLLPLKTKNDHPVRLFRQYFEIHACISL